jgi:hypothetical protein
MTSINDRLRESLFILTGSEKSPTKNISSKEQLDDKRFLQRWGFEASLCSCCGKANSEMEGRLMQCARCMRAYYCSSQCFNEHLPAHAKVCGHAGTLDVAVVPSLFVPISSIGENIKIKSPIKSPGKSPKKKVTNESSPTKSNKIGSPRKVSASPSPQLMSLPDMPLLDTFVGDMGRPISSIGENIKIKSPIKSPGKSPKKKVTNESSPTKSNKIGSPRKVSASPSPQLMSLPDMPLLDTPSKSGCRDKDVYKKTPTEYMSDDETIEEIVVEYVDVIKKKRKPVRNETTVGQGHDASDLFDYLFEYNKPVDRVDAKDNGMPADIVYNKGYASLGVDRLLLVITSKTTHLHEVVNQRETFSFLGTNEICFDVLDGNVPKSKEQLAQLFELSGRRDQYPQFFLRRRDGSLEFWGGWYEYTKAKKEGRLAKELGKPPKQT